MLFTVTVKSKGQRVQKTAKKEANPEQDLCFASAMLNTAGVRATGILATA